MNPLRTMCNKFRIIMRAGWPRTTRATKSPRIRAKNFLGARTGAVAVEAALAISVLILALGALMAVVHAAYTGDRMDRGARAAARAVALAADRTALAAIACEAVKRELDLDDDFDCADAWTLVVETGLTPAVLADGPGGDGGAMVVGDMVRVRIAWRGAPWSALLRDTGQRNAAGLARSEPAPAPAGG